MPGCKALCELWPSARPPAAVQQLLQPDAVMADRAEPAGALISLYQTLHVAPTNAWTVGQSPGTETHSMHPPHLLDSGLHQLIAAPGNDGGVVLAVMLQKLGW